MSDIYLATTDKQRKELLRSRKAEAERIKQSIKTRQKEMEERVRKARELDRISLLSKQKTPKILPKIKTQIKSKIKTVLKRKKKKR